MALTEASQQHTVADILKTENKIRFQASQTLSQVLSKLTSSQDAAFVFDKDKFIGVISPYYIFQERSLKPSSRLKTCVRMPPKLSPSTSLTNTAQHMIQSKIYYLPVFERDEFIGVASVKRLFKYIADHHLLNGTSRILFSNRPLVTGKETMVISQAIALMNREKISKLPVVNQENHLVGIITQHDLKKIIEPINSLGKYDRVGEKQQYNDVPIKDYMKNYVITVNRIPTFYQAVNLMDKHNIGSLVIVDNNNTPMSIITKKDLLQTIASSLSI